MYYNYRVSLKSSHVNSLGSADDGFATFIGLDSHSSQDCIGDIEHNIELISRVYHKGSERRGLTS